VDYPLTPLFTARAVSPFSPIDLPGSPQYYRFIRLTNAQWAQSVQDIFQLPTPSGLEARFESPVAGSTDCAPTAGR